MIEICETGIGAPSATHVTSSGSMGPLRDGNEIELTPVRSTRTAASSSFEAAEIGCRLVTKSPTADTANCEAHPLTWSSLPATWHRAESSVLCRRASRVLGRSSQRTCCGSRPKHDGRGRTRRAGDILQRSGGRAFGQDPRAQDFA